MSSRDVDALAIVSILLGIKNLQENRQQLCQQEQILHEISEKFDALEKRIDMLISAQTQNPPMK